MKVLVSDQLGEAGIEMFQAAAGIDVDVKTGLAPEALLEIIGDYDALVIRSATKVTAELIAKADNLKVVGRAGIGLDNVDIPAATKRGIIVMNTPTGNVVTTAEHAISMMMALTRNIPRGTSSLKAGRWDKKLLQGREVYNKTLGVLGYGKIGAIVADRARGLKMRVIAYDPYIPPEQIQLDGFEAVSLSDLYQRADYITIHVPRIKDTIGLIDKAAFDAMKDGVMIINCARGGIINEDDLDAAIKAGKVAGAALDVFETEPPGSCALVESDNVICTPHLGASTKEAQTNVAVDVAKQIIDYLNSGTIMNAVNAPSVAGEQLRHIGPYLNLGERIGCMAAQLCSGPVTEVNIEYAGDFQKMDLSPVTTGILKGLLTPMVKDTVNYVNANVFAQDRGIKVSESQTSDADEYINLTTVKAATTQTACSLSGTIFGKQQATLVRIDDFKLTMEPAGHLAYIRCSNKAGTGASITSLLADKKININRMSLGGSDDGGTSKVLLATDISIPEDVLKEIESSPLVESITLVEL